MAQNSCKLETVIIDGQSYDIHTLEKGEYKRLVIEPVYGDPYHPSNKFHENEQGLHQSLPCYEKDSLYISEPLLERARYMDDLLHSLSHGKFSLGIWDAYRPHEAAKEMDRRCDSGKVPLPDDAQCATYVTDVSQGKTSGHSRGSSGDFFIADNTTGNSIHSLDFDAFGRQARFLPDADLKAHVTDFQSQGYQIDAGLQRWFGTLSPEEQLYFIMSVSGMKAYSEEFWHFGMQDPKVKLPRPKSIPSSSDSILTAPDRRTSSNKPAVTATDQIRERPIYETAVTFGPEEVLWHNDRAWCFEPDNTGDQIILDYSKNPLRSVQGIQIDNGFTWTNKTYHDYSRPKNILVTLYDSRRNVVYSQEHYLQDRGTRKNREDPSTAYPYEERLQYLNIGYEGEVAAVEIFPLEFYEGGLGFDAGVCLSEIIVKE